jgi:hypothetical protein
MKESADVIEKLLRPHGHAFIFCSFQQAMEWRSVLESAVGGSSLKLPAVTEVIIRNHTAVHSAVRFLYHRFNAYETAWHACKDKAGGNQNDYRTTVGFVNTSIELCSGTSLPLY